MSVRRHDSNFSFSSFLMKVTVIPCGFWVLVLIDDSSYPSWAAGGALSCANFHSCIKFSVFKGTTNSCSLAFGGFGIHCSCGCETFYRLTDNSGGDHSERQLSVVEAGPTVGRAFTTGAFRSVVSDVDDLLQRFNFKQQHCRPNLTRNQPDSGIIPIPDVFVFLVFGLKCWHLAVCSASCDSFTFLKARYKNTSISLEKQFIKLMWHRGPRQENICPPPTTANDRASAATSLHPRQEACSKKQALISAEPLATQEAIPNKTDCWDARHSHVQPLSRWSCWVEKRFHLGGGSR